MGSPRARLGLGGKDRGSDGLLHSPPSTIRASLYTPRTRERDKKNRTPGPERENHSIKRITRTANIFCN